MKILPQATCDKIKDQRTAKQKEGRSRRHEQGLEGRVGFDDASERVVQEQELP